MTRAAASLAFLIAALFAGCNREVSSLSDAGACIASGQYPAGPFGFGPPNIVADVRLNGHDDDAMGMPTQAPHDIHFHDYYQNQQARVLVVLVAADWCNPCKMEQPTMVSLYNAYQSSNPGEVAFVESITQDNMGNIAAISDVDVWAKTYKDPFTMAADPDNVLSGYLGTTLFPGQMVIRTCDMSIVWKNNGPSDMLKSQIDAVLAGG
jgi:hypothetical protein